jgi:uncharacterized protein YndB with AHSA1/START domain
MRSKFTIEYEIGSTVSSLYNRLSTENGLSSWFADSVDLNNGVYTFKWRKVSEQARLIASKENSFIKFQWEEDADSEYYFQFSIVSHELTGDVSLIVEDFALECDIEDSVNFWDTNIAKLRRALGSF